MNIITRRLSLAALCLFGSSAHAEGDSFFSRYNLGLSYDVSSSQAQITYKAPAMPNTPDDCTREPETTMRCTAYLAPDTSDTTYPTVYLEAPFQRQGWTYLTYGFTFRMVTYKGGIVQTPKTFSTQKAKSQPEPDQPLTKAFLELYGLNWQTYVRVGVTPPYLPDLFVTAGAGVQTVAGRVKVFKTDKVGGTIQPEVFGEVEIVPLRFATGALSIYLGRDQSLFSNVGTNLIADNPSDTELTDFTLSLQTGSAGIRLLFPF